MPRTPERPRRITLVRNGPLLVEGPVEVVGEDGAVAVSHRFIVAICMCRRSRSYPWCDTSHRTRTKRASDPIDGAGSTESAESLNCPATDLSWKEGQ
ncbi:CDGSH iron-sulfur domain-containing protein [Streptomyces platensis]|uniref:CDGSH iron-sulfur domain-containing protein n=1 Tax=Streptomyces platensis TaxID=58346 RepID=UPI001F2BFFFB|nr:CDGSH iron-sulfur domain-containing protein [Streptomyces platensis]MCF3145453.1 CDGSH iron-sulfur domain-containing protein [Streptomyces platensis]